MARSGPSLASRLGGARAAVDPGGAGSLTAGLLVLVFASGVMIGVTEATRTVTRPQGPVVQLTVDLPGVPAEARESVLRLPGTGAGVVVLSSARRRPFVLALVADCSALARYAGSPLPGCRAGASYASDATAPGQTIALPLGPGGAVTDLPAPTRLLPTDVAADVRPIRVVVVRAAGTVSSEQGQIVLRTPRANLDATMAALVSLAPYGQPDAVGLNPADAEHHSLVDGVIRFGFGLGALVTFLAFAVAAVDRAAERRAADTALLVLGLPARTLRRSQVWEIVLTTGTALAVAATAGVLGSLAWQFTLGPDRSADTVALVLLVAGAMAAAVVAALVAAAVSTRSIDLAALRRD